MAEIPKNQTWGRQDLYPYRNKEDRLQQIDDLREVIYSGWLKDEAQKRRISYSQQLWHYESFYGRDKWLKTERILEPLLAKRLPPKEKKPLDWYPWPDYGLYTEKQLKKQLNIAREALYTRWIEDRAEERRRELVLMVSMYPPDPNLGTPDKYFDEWMVINDFFLEEMANPNLRGKKYDTTPQVYETEIWIAPLSQETS